MRGKPDLGGSQALAHDAELLLMGGVAHAAGLRFQALLLRPRTGQLQPPAHIKPGTIDLE